MNTVGAIFAALIILLLAYALVVLIPVGFGKLFLSWSGKRCRYILSQSFSSMIVSLVVTLVLTGLILFVGVVFKQQWAFSGGLLFVYIFWLSIKTVVNNIKLSRGM